MTRKIRIVSILALLALSSLSSGRSFSTNGMKTRKDHFAPFFILDLPTSSLQPLPLLFSIEAATRPLSILTKAMNLARQSSLPDQEAAEELWNHKFLKRNHGGLNFMDFMVKPGAKGKPDQRNTRRASNQ